MTPPTAEQIALRNRLLAISEKMERASVALAATDVKSARAQLITVRADLAAVRDALDKR